MKSKSQQKNKKRTLWFSRLRYLVLWMLSVLWYLFYQSYVSFYLFVFMTLLPFVSLIVLCLGHKKEMIKIRFDEEEAHAGSTHKIVLTYQNKGLPIAYCQGVGEMYNQFYETKEKCSLNFLSVSGNYAFHEQKYQVCGCYHVTLPKVYYTDLLRLWRLSYKHEKHADLLILPQRYSSEAIQTSVLQGMEKEKESHRKGDFAYSDSYDVVEYREGDSLKRMHYKLSYKIGKPMVRQYSNLEEASIYLLIDLQGTIEECEKTLATFYSLALTFLQNQHKIICCWQSLHLVKEQQIHTSEELGLLMQEMLRNPRATSSMPIHHENDVAYSIKGELIEPLTKEEPPRET